MVPVAFPCRPSPRFGPMSEGRWRSRRTVCQQRRSAVGLERVTVARCDRQRPCRHIRDGKGSRTLQSKSAVLRMRCTVIQQDPGSVRPCPAQSVTFLSVIYKILTHNRVMEKVARRQPKGEARGPPHKVGRKKTAPTERSQQSL